MIAPADLTTMLKQSAIDSTHIETIAATAFGTVESLTRLRELTSELEREAAHDSAEAREAALRAGICNWMLGRSQRALDFLAKGKNTKERHFYAGWCHRDLGVFDKAAAEFEKAAAAGWDEVACAAERADTLVLADNCPAAKALLDQTSTRGQFVATWHYAKGRNLEREGHAVEALAAYEHAIQIEPTHSRALFHLAFLYDLHGSDDDAIDMYTRCTDQPPVHVNALINLSVLHEDHGDNGSAEQCLRRVLAAHPNHARAALFLKDVTATHTQVIDEQWERQNEQWHAILETPISDYELSVRSRNCLKKLNINTLGDLTRITQPELLAYKNFGETSLNEIKAMLTQKGLRLGQAKENEAAAAAPVRSAVRAKTPAPGNPELMSRQVSELELSVRSRKCLQRLNIASVGELCSRSEAELLAVRNFGQTSLNEIKRRLHELGTSLRPNS